MVVAMKIVDSALKSESCKSNDIFKFRNFHFTVIFSQMLSNLPKVKNQGQ